MANMTGIADQIFSDLESFHTATGLGSKSHEAAICRHIAAAFFRRSKPAFACIAYPDAARHDDGVTRDECDLVIEVAAREWLWIEAKQIWKPGAAHWLWADATNDVTKLLTLKPPEAMYVGLLLIGLDTTVREQFYLQRDIEGRFVAGAKLGNWSHNARQFAPRDGQRVNGWFWCRPTT